MQGNTQIALEKEYSSSGLIILTADIGNIDLLRERQIRDSTKYKRALGLHLEETKLVVREEEIPKSKNYTVKYGYLARRIK